MTLHKALGLLAGEDAAYSEPQMLDADLVVVDEVSMMDIYLANHLFQAVPRGSQLVLVGDADQLPSVGPGAVLSEIIACGAVPVMRLDRIFRQSHGSRIAANAKYIRHGNLSLEYGDDFQFFDSSDMEDSAQLIERLYMQEISKYGLDNVALLSPYRQKTETGVNALNERLQSIVNPQDGKKPEILYRNRIYRMGDKVMQTKNCEDVSNGDIGYITSITTDDSDSMLTVDFGDGRVAEYEKSDLELLDLAYASTIHKSQGSEYKSVIINLQRSCWFARWSTRQSHVQKSGSLLSVNGAHCVSPSDAQTQSSAEQSLRRGSDRWLRPVIRECWQTDRFACFQKM